MLQKMRLGRVLVGSAVLVLFAWIGWNALSRLPGMWARFRAPAASTVRQDIDTTLFQGDSGISADTGSLVQDTGLTAVLARLAPVLGVARRTTGAIRSPVGDLPLYSLVLHRGNPLPAMAAQTIDSLESHGFTILESIESPRGTWPWACRLGVGDAPLAILRARTGDLAAPGTFGMSIVLWADSIPTSWLPSLALLPRGTVLALPPDRVAEERLRQLALSHGIRLALLTRLETSRLPVLRQEATRLLLHHGEDTLENRLRLPDGDSARPEGLVVVDGDRGAGDPDLSHRIASYCRRNDLWLLDATGASSSKLDQASLEVGGGNLPSSRPGGTSPFGRALESARVRAEKSGQGFLVWPLDSFVVDRLAANLPFLTDRGIEIRVPQPIYRHNGTGD